MVYSTLLGLFDKCLGTPDGKCGISPGAYLWGPCSVDIVVLITCADKCVSLPTVSALTTWADMSPWQIDVFTLM